MSEGREEPPRKRIRVEDNQGTSFWSVPQSLDFPLFSSRPAHNTTISATEESSTDDEENHSTGLLVESSESTVLVYEDVAREVFKWAREPKPHMLDKCLGEVQQSHNGREILSRLVSDEDENGFTLLMIGVRQHLPSLCQFLLDNGADVNQTNSKRLCALQLAAQKGHTDMTEMLMRNGASEEAKNTAIIPAAHFGHLSTVQRLIDYGANANYANLKGTTPLMRAAQEGREAVVHFLLERRSDPCAANNEGMTALMLAAQRGHASIATLLIEAGSDVNTQTRQGSTALLLAAKRGHLEAVEALLTAGADIFKKDDRDKTAAETAHRRGHVRLFLQITVSNQLRLMRNELRRKRSRELMRMSSLVVHGRATVLKTPCPKRHQVTRELLDRSMRLPKPLLQNIAQFLPTCRLWTRQMEYLEYDAVFRPHCVVQHGVYLIDEVLSSFALEMRPTLKDIRERAGRETFTGHLALLRESPEFRALFENNKLPLPRDTMKRCYRMADVQGVLATYPSTTAVQFGVSVSQDVVELLKDLLDWDWDRQSFEMEEATIEVAE